MGDNPHRSHGELIDLIIEKSKLEEADAFYLHLKKITILVIFMLNHISIVEVNLLKKKIENHQILLTNLIHQINFMVIKI